MKYIPFCPGIELNCLQGQYTHETFRDRHKSAFVYKLSCVFQYVRSARQTCGPFVEVVTSVSEHTVLLVKQDQVFTKSSITH